MRINPITSQFKLTRQEKTNNNSKQIMPMSDTMMGKDIYTFSTSPVYSLQSSSLNFKGIKSLVKAIQEGNLKDVNAEIERCPDIINCLSEEMEIPGLNNKVKIPPLAVAAIFKQDEIFDELLKKPSLDINIPFDFGYDSSTKYRMNINDGTILMLTSVPNLFPFPYAIFEKLLAHPNIDINKKESMYGYTPLMVFTDSDDIATVKALLKHPNIDINMQDTTHRKNTALHNANSEITRELLKHPDINVNLQNKYGNTALHLAVDDNKIEKIKEILKHPNVDLSLKNDIGHDVYDLCVDKPEIKALLDGYKRGVDRRERVYTKSGGIYIKSENNSSAQTNQIPKPPIDVNNLTPEKSIWTQKEISRHFLDLVQKKDLDNATLMLCETPLIDLESNNQEIFKGVLQTNSPAFVGIVYEYKNHQETMLKEYEEKRKIFLDQTIKTLPYEQLKENPMITTPEGFKLLMDKEEFNPNDKHSFFGKEMTLFEEACLIDSEGDLAEQILSTYDDVDTKNVSSTNQKIMSAIDEYESFGKFKIKLMNPEKRQKALDEIESFITSDKYNPEKTDSLGNNFLHIVSQVPSQKRIIKKLIDKGTNINKKNVAEETPIMSAMKELSITDATNDRTGLMENITYMTYRDADLNAQDRNKDSVWHYVCRTSSQALLSFMWEKGINILLKNAKGEYGASLITDEAVKNVYKQCISRISI